jgi:beta-alanine--pyruvate transaminase
VVIRATGDTIALTPPLIATESDIAEIFGKVARVIEAVK